MSTNAHVFHLSPKQLTPPNYKTEAAPTMPYSPDLQFMHFKCEVGEPGPTLRYKMNLRVGP